MGGCYGAGAAEKQYVGDNIFMNVENRLSGNEKLHLDTLVSVFLTLKYSRRNT
jgi:hypothetical protein